MKGIEGGSPKPRITAKRQEELSRRTFMTNSLAAGMTAFGTAGGIGAGMGGGIASMHENRRPGRFVEQAKVALDGRHVRWIGLDHTLQTFEANEPEIRKQVSESPFVILEYFQEQMRGRAKPDTSREEVKKLVTVAEQFFASVGRVCAEEGKDVVVVNPDTPAAMLSYAFLAMGLPMGLILKAFSDISNGTQTKEKALVESVLTLPIFAMYLTEAGGARAFRDYLDQEDGAPAMENKADAFGFSNSDWRDVVTAKGTRLALERYGQDADDTHPVTAYHGGLHYGTIEYLQKPELVREKERAYAGHNLIGDLSLRRYHFDRDSNSWAVADRVSLS